MTTAQPAPDQPAPDFRRLLAQAISREVAGGWRVESQSDVQAVLVSGKEINHLLHLIITVVTVCIPVWAFVWLALWIINKPKRLVIQIDDYGNVLRQLA